jgi:dipeptidyl aminopeptidase/acylaminoacyl peptidase
MEVRLNKYFSRFQSVVGALKYSLSITALIIGLLPAVGLSQSFTIQQALSAPYDGVLTAAPAKGRLAWVAELEGRRNIWLAEPNADGKGYSSRQLTHYTEDDGQELSALTWTPDGANIVYVRGDDAQGPFHTVPNSAWFPLGAKQQIWEISADGGEPQLIAEGNSPQIAPNGKTLAFLARGQVATISLGVQNAKPEQVLQMHGGTLSLRWSPDSSSIAFVSYRGDHSFVAVYSVAEKSLNYLDPSTDVDFSFDWSPDSKRIALLRVPYARPGLWFQARRTAQPWSIRVADVATGQGHEVWRAADGVGSAYQPTESADQLYWVAGDRIVFPWERDGWLHFYSVPVAGGTASLLTPGEFEVQHVNLSFDRKTLVFDSNQGDIDRRHVWKLNFADNVSTAAPDAVTSGSGIETQPVVASDNTSVAVLRSNAHFPTRAAIAKDGRFLDLAPQTIPPDFPGARFVEPQQVIFPASDGLAIHGQLYLPSGLKPGERHPAVVFFHGGSRRQMLLGFQWIKYYSDAYAMDQYLVSKGYIVLSVNYRSGLGYGLNFREALNFGPSGASEFNDVTGAGLYLKSRTDVDGKRIGVWGGSYGGLLTALALARSSDVFAAGVDFSGVADWNNIMHTLSPGYNPIDDPKQAQTAYLSSPIASVSIWQSPVLLIQGDEDQDVPFSETVNLATALRKQRVDVEELVFPDELHQILLRRNWIRAYSAMEDFLDRKLAKGQ